MSRRSASFQLIVHYPSSEEDQKELRTCVAEVHADKIYQFLESLNWCSDYKIKFIDSMIDAMQNER